ncbi:hypothetical protein Roomu2_00099 [Pseudomonas phage vB_PpuM-Roomu-2]|uniref:Fibrinogen C-terminal domain-containing protein n=1 Tax=Pseudomonas phage vB_PpuM-Roomu-2 TaxID=3132621 RepID=A0AAX4MZ70_9CAUD
MATLIKMEVSSDKQVLGGQMQEGKHYVSLDLAGNPRYLVVCTKENLRGGHWVNLSTGYSAQSGDSAYWYEVNLQEIKYNHVEA